MTSTGSINSYSSGISRHTTRLPLRCSRNFLESLLRCDFSITHMRSAQANNSGDTGTVASFANPADRVSTPGQSANTCSAVGLLRRFCEHTKRTFVDTAIFCPNGYGMASAVREAWRVSVGSSLARAASTNSCGGQARLGASRLWLWLWASCGRTVAISSSRPKDYPLRRTSSRVCCIALFCLSAPTNLSHRKSVFRTGWGPATAWTSAGKASLNLRGSVIHKI